MKPIEIFPWNDKFDTGLELVDKQHKTLVSLLNKLANHLIQVEEDFELNSIFNELVAYTQYHFQTEEEIWQTYLPNEASELKHRNDHKKFILKLESLINKQQHKLPIEVAERTLSFLIKWLASHILESDRYMAYVVFGLRDGLTMDEAQAKAKYKMRGFTRRMINIILSVYDTLSSNTLSLLKKLHENKQLEKSIDESRRVAEKAVSQYAHTNDELLKQKGFLKSLIKTLPDLVWMKDKQGVYLACNSRFEQFFGAREEEILGKTDYDFVSKELADFFRAHDLQAVDNDAPTINEETIVFASDGHKELLETTKTPMFNEQGELLGVLGIGHNISERKEMEEALRESELRFRLAGEVAYDLIYEWEPATDTIEWFGDIDGLLGFEKGEISNSVEHWLSLIHPQDRVKLARAVEAHKTYTKPYLYDYRIRAKDGSYQYWNDRAAPVLNEQGLPIKWVGVCSNITSVKKYQQELEYIAHYDVLTDLPNRVLLSSRLEHAITQSSRSKRFICVAYLDLDNFKVVNDNFGHEAGDKLLIEVSKRMKVVLRKGDTLGRLGGDEFIAVLLDLNERSEVFQVVERLIKTVSSPVKYNGSEFEVKASIGLTFYPQEEDTNVDNLLRQADQAMYKAKQAGGNCFHIFDTQYDRSIRYYHEFHEQIRHALINYELFMLYQPVVNMKTGQVTGLEALIRWNHPQKGVLDAEAFIPTVTNQPIAIEVGEWVLEQVFKQLNTWQQQGLNISICVNIDALHLQQCDFLTKLKSFINKYPRVL